MYPLTVDMLCGGTQSARKRIKEQVLPQHLRPLRRFTVLYDNVM